MASGVKVEPDLLAKIQRAEKATANETAGPDRTPKEPDFIITKHQIMRKKGKWVRFPKVSKPPDDESGG
jgi:hypothetical protein